MPRSLQIFRTSFIQSYAARSATYANVTTFLGFFINGGKREFRHGVYISLGHDFFGKLGPDLHFSIYE